MFYLYITLPFNYKKVDKTIQFSPIPFYQKPICERRYRLGSSSQRGTLPILSFSSWVGQVDVVIEAQVYDTTDRLLGSTAWRQAL